MYIHDTTPWFVDHTIIIYEPCNDTTYNQGILRYVPDTVATCWYKRYRQRILINTF